MKQSEINAMDSYERRRELANAEDLIYGMLNVASPEDISLDVCYTIEEVDDALSRLLFPDCSCRRRNSYCETYHSFPKWFVKEVEPYAKAYRRLWLQIEKARSLDHD